MNKSYRIYVEPIRSRRLAILTVGAAAALGGLLLIAGWIGDGDTLSQPSRAEVRLATPRPVPDALRLATSRPVADPLIVASPAVTGKVPDPLPATLGNPFSARGASDADAADADAVGAGTEVTFTADDGTATKIPVSGVVVSADGKVVPIPKDSSGFMMSADGNSVPTPKGGFGMSSDGKITVMPQ